MLKFIVKKLNNLDDNTKEVLLKSSTSTIIQLLGIFSRLVTSIFLGRVLGPSGLGEVNFINQLVIILMVFSTFGLDHVIVKQVAIGKSKKDDYLIGSNVYTGLLLNSLISIVVASIGVLCSKYITASFNNNSNLIYSFIIASLMLVPQTLVILFASAINGFKKVWQSRFLRDTLTSLIVLIGIGVYYYTNVEITVFLIIILYLIGRLISLLVSIFYWKKLFSKFYVKKFLGKKLLKTSLPLFLVAGTTIVSSSLDIVMLGWLDNSYSVGLYSVASRLIIFMGLFLQMSNSALGPKIAALYANDKIKELETMIRKVTLVLIYIAVLSIFIILFFGKQILGVWGEDFTKSYLLLVILSVGQFANISTGCSAVLLIMSGNEKVLGKISFCFIVLNILLNYILISNYGVIGAAIATSFTLLGENIVKVIVAKKKTGILTIPINKL